MPVAMVVEALVVGRMEVVAHVAASTEQVAVEKGGHGEALEALAAQVEAVVPDDAKHRGAAPGGRESQQDQPHQKSTVQVLQGPRGARHAQTHRQGPQDRN